MDKIDTKATKSLIIWNNIVSVLIVLFFTVVSYASVNLFTKHLFNNWVNILVCLAVIFSWIWFLWYFSKKKECYKIAQKVSRLDISNRKLLIFLLPFLIRMIVIALYKFTDQGDIGVYLSVSKDLVNLGHVDANADYSLQFPHLFWFGLFLTPISLINQNYWAYEIFINCLLSIEQVLIYYALLQYNNNKALASLIAIIWGFLPSQIFSCLAVTHEMGYNFFFILLVYLLSRYNIKNKWLCWMSVCIVLSVMKLINSMSIIVFISIIILTIFQKDKFSKKANKILSLIFCFIIISLVSFPIQENLTIGDKTADRSSFWHNILIGANINSSGQWNDKDGSIEEEAIQEYLKTHSYTEYSDRGKVIKKIAISRWQNLVRSPQKLLKLLFNKFIYMWSGTHYPFGLAKAYSLGIKQKALDVLIGINGFIYFALSSITLLYNMKIMKRKINNINCTSILMKTIICGAVCVFSLTEVMNKYNYTMVIPLYYLFAEGVINLSNEFILPNNETT